MSHVDLKLDIRVRRMHTQLQRALDWPQRSSGGQDMIICPNVVLMLHMQPSGMSETCMLSAVGLPPNRWLLPYYKQ